MIQQIIHWICHLIQYLLPAVKYDHMLKFGLEILTLEERLQTGLNAIFCEWTEVKTELKLTGLSVLRVQVSICVC